MSLTNINPVKRLEYFLQDIADGAETSAKTPVRRVEEFLRRIRAKIWEHGESIETLLNDRDFYGASNPNYQPCLTLNGSYIENYLIYYTRRIAVIMLELNLPANYEIPTDGLVLASYDRTTSGAPLQALSAARYPIGDPSGAYVLTTEGYPYGNEIKLRRRNFDNRIISGGPYFTTLTAIKEV